MPFEDVFRRSIRQDYPHAPNVQMGSRASSWTGSTEPDAPLLYRRLGGRVRPRPVAARVSWLRLSGLTVESVAQCGEGLLDDAIERPFSALFPGDETCADELLHVV